MPKKSSTSKLIKFEKNSQRLYSNQYLYFSRVWKEITLNSSSDQVEYRVWDYPIKEQYGHIFQAITQVGPVKSVEEGFQKVRTKKQRDLRKTIQ